jgi:hypothetical protein
MADDELVWKILAEFAVEPAGCGLMGRWNQGERA